MIVYNFNFEVVHWLDEIVKQKQTHHNVKDPYFGVGERLRDGE